MRRRTKTLPSSPVVYPSGSFIRTEKGYFYIVSLSKRYRFVSERVLASWNPQRIIDTTEAAVSKYKISAKMKFRSGSLIHNLADGKIFLIEGSKRRHITSPDALERIGAKMKEVVTVSLDEINLHEEGEPL